MTLAAFLRSLFDNGCVRLPTVVPFDAAALVGADAELIAFERLARQELPGDPPAFDLDVARWAALLFFRACQFVVYRDVPADVVQSELRAPLPARRRPDVDYSVDLTLRYLPDLFAFARAAAENDPLVAELRTLAVRWPLSSVGIAGLGDLDVSGFIDHPSLRGLYVDRILARGDSTRLADPRVKAAVTTAVGLHRELAGKLPLETTHER